MNIPLLLSILVASLLSPSSIKSQPLPEGGASIQYKTEDNLGNYAFGYNEDHTSGGSFRKEVGDIFGNKVGSYGLHVADGRARVVNYVADSAGFRADVHTNEPGVDPSQDPAHVAVNKPTIAVVAPPPAVVSHSVALPTVVHKTVLGAPASHHHAIRLLQSPFHPVFVPTVLSHVPHVLL